MESRKLTHRLWSWDINGITIQDIKMSRVDYYIRWEEIEGIGKNYLRLERGKRAMLVGGESEVRELRNTLSSEWKARCPCRWVAASERSTHAMRQVFLFILPGVTLLVMVAPWVGIYLFIQFHGYLMPELIEKCIRMVIGGLVFFVGEIGFFFWKIRKIMRVEMQEAERVASEYKCYQSAPSDGDKRSNCIWC